MECDNIFVDILESVKQDFVFVEFYNKSMSVRLLLE